MLSNKVNHPECTIREKRVYWPRPERPELKKNVKRPGPNGPNDPNKKLKIQNGTGTCTTISKGGPNGTGSSYDDIQKIQIKLVARTMRISPHKLSNISLDAEFDNLAEINRNSRPSWLRPTESFLLTNTRPMVALVPSHTPGWMCFVPATLSWADFVRDYHFRRMSTNGSRWWAVLLLSLRVHDW